jgi:hypothetical protein
MLQFIADFSVPTLDSVAESKLMHLISYVLQNVSHHPANRTLMYKAELLGTTALDKLIEHVSHFGQGHAWYLELLHVLPMNRSSAVNLHQVCAAGQISTRTGSRVCIQYVACRLFRSTGHRGG